MTALPHDPRSGIASTSCSDAERYAWIRGHRGDYDLTTAIHCSNYDNDFDQAIDRLIRATAVGCRGSLPHDPLRFV